ncbi:MAG: NAD(P)/FAD-dependent oxidoreductase [Gemmatimonadaceae bacterium]|nr:NAD(P)/FAD-dependent oxidoreductase [Gemmatimonadaceae bacterium]
MPTEPLPRATQVLVVGGGPAGSSTAWYCAEAGLDVVLIDRARFPRAKPCAEYLSPEGARILSAMGALEAIEAQAAALTGMEVHAPSGRRIHGEFVARHGFRGFRDRGLGIRREVLDTVLIERVRARGVQVIEGVKVEDVLHDAAGRAAGVRVRTVDGPHDILADVVIGADGLRSIVARRLGLAHTSRWPRRIALVAHYRGIDGMTSLGEMHVAADGYLGLADVGDNVTNVALVVSAPDARTMSGDPEAFLNAWIGRQAALAPRFAGARRVSPVRATGPFASRARRPWSAGAALVGDAADFFDPFTGEGIFAALRGGELLAPFVVEAAAAFARRDTHAERNAWQGYETARRHTFAGKWRVERLIGTAVAFPRLMNGAARVLERDRDLSDLLIGITGDFVPASAMLRPHTLWRIATALLRGTTPSALPEWPPSPISTSVSPHVHRP